MTSKPILIVGEAWGENEAKIGAPFCGASGNELLKMLHEAKVINLTSTDRDYINKFWKEGRPEYLDAVWKLHSDEVLRTNVINRHPPKNNLEAFCGGKKDGIQGFPAITKAKYLRQEFIPELERLADEIVELDPNLILALGNTPLWALCGVIAISKLRGTTRTTTHTVTGFKILPTYHPAAVLRQWKLRPTVIADFIKAKRENGYAEVKRQAREIWIEPSLEDLEEFYGRYIHGCNILAVDIETAGNQITCIGFAPSHRVALVIPFFDGRGKRGNYWATSSDERAAWNFVRRTLQEPSIRKVFQNGLYDIAFLWRSAKIPVYSAKEDTMLLHHALQPEALKGLGFLGSVYADEGAWKVERKGTETIKRDE